ncbi:MAG: LuxR C-terminal-related transcriptional regulator [Thermomicrobiales bacterium]
MLETIREYGLDGLVASGEGEATRRWHAAHFLAMVESAEAALLGPEQTAWLDRLEAEHDNLRAALAWALAADDAEIALRLAGGLWRFWHLHGHLEEGSGWLRRALAHGRAASGRARAGALDGAGALAGLQGRHAEAVALLEEAVALRREAGESARLGRSLHMLGIAWQLQADHVHAASLIEEALPLYRTSVGYTDRTWMALALAQLGNSVAALGDVERAMTLGEEALALQRELDNPLGVAFARFYLGELCQLRAEPARAAAHYREGLALIWRHGHGPAMLATGLTGLAIVLAASGDAARSVRLAGAAEVLRQTASYPIEPRAQAAYEHALAIARIALGEQAFTAAWTTGRALTTEQAVAEAAAVTPPPAATAATTPASAATAGMTPRELEVLRLVADGRSDRDIAVLLSISSRTAGNHVANVLEKLGVGSRAAAVAFATRHGLI